MVQTAAVIRMTRYAVYFAPPPRDFSRLAAGWLGWDPATGQTLPRPTLPGSDADVAAITRDAGRYGFHATLRAPFRPGVGISAARIADTVAALAAGLLPVTCTGLQLENLQGFLALTPIGGRAALRTLAAAIVRATDPLRAPLTAAEIARRRPDRLTARQRQLLNRWGYPFVLQEFGFHMTLTDRLPPDQAAGMLHRLGAHIAPVLPRPFRIDDLCLFGEDAGGRFHLMHRFALAG